SLETPPRPPTPADTIVEEAVQIRTARSRWRECARDYTNMCNRRIGRGRRDQEAGGVEPGLITEEGVLRWWTAPFVRGRQSNGGHWVENTVEGNRASAPAKPLLSRDSSSTMARGVDEMTMGEGEEAGSGRVSQRRKTASLSFGARVDPTADRCRRSVPRMYKPSMTES
ncbi:unnamed protein product, partial [Mycena citricolor]